MSGLKLIEEIRKLNPNMRFLLCSGSMTGRMAQDLHVPFLAKPFESSALLEAVRKLIQE